MLVAAVWVLINGSERQPGTGVAVCDTLHVHSQWLLYCVRDGQFWVLMHV